MAGGIRTMDAQSLTRQARQTGEKIKQDVPSQYRTEIKNILDELTGRVAFVATGQPPRTKTSYQALEASALAQQARHVMSQIARNIPVEKREMLEIVGTLADRVEFAAIGAPSTAIARTTPKRTTRSRPKARTGTRTRTNGKRKTTRVPKPIGTQMGGGFRP